MLRAGDKPDTTRTASPLTLAPDATLINTTGVPIADVISRAQFTPLIAEVRFIGEGGSKAEYFRSIPTSAIRNLQ